MNEDIKLIQQSLFNLGYDPKGIDGIFGKGTANALRELADNGPKPKEELRPVTSKKIAVIIGHNVRAQGAERVTDSESEYVWNSKLAAELSLFPSVRVFRREAGLPYWKEIDNVYKEVDNWGADVSIELHFNASSNRTATGTETLSSGSSRSMNVARAVQRKMVEVLSLRDRGVIPVKSTERGGRGLHKGKAPAVLLEPYFGSNPDDCRRVDGQLPVLARAIHDAALEGIR